MVFEVLRREAGVGLSREINGRRWVVLWAALVAVSCPGIVFRDACGKMPTFSKRSIVFVCELGPSYSLTIVSVVAVEFV